MSLAVIAVVNFVLVSFVVSAIVALHTWAIRTAHRDHVPAVPSAPMALQFEEPISDELPLVPALA